MWASVACVPESSLRLAGPLVSRATRVEKLLRIAPAIAQELQSSTCSRGQRVLITFAGWTRYGSLKYANMVLCLNSPEDTTALRSAHVSSGLTFNASMSAREIVYAARGPGMIPYVGQKQRSTEVRVLAGMVGCNSDDISVVLWIVLLRACDVRVVVVAAKGQL